jgi:hypothetical protein
VRASIKKIGIPRNVYLTEIEGKWCEFGTLNLLSNLQQVIFVPWSHVKDEAVTQRVLDTMESWAEKEYDVVRA